MKVSRSLRRQWPTTTPTRLGDLVVRSGAGITKARSPRPMSVSSFVSGSCRDSRRACNNPTNTTAYQNQLRSAILLLKIVSWLKDLPRHERHAEPRPQRGPQRGCGPAPQTRRRADCTETPGHGRLSPPGPVCGGEGQKCTVICSVFVTEQSMLEQIRGTLRAEQFWSAVAFSATSVASSPACRPGAC